jgi:glycosyltransferase 2 family protein
VVDDARPGLLGLMLVTIFAERLFAAWRWWVLLRLNEPGIGFWPVLRVTLVANYIGTFLPGGVGIEVLRIHGLARLTDLALALSSVVVERLFGLLALVLMIGVGLLLAQIRLPAAVSLMVGLGLLGLLTAGLALVHPWPRRIGRLILAWPRLSRLRTSLIGLEHRLDGYLHRPLALLASLLLAFLFQTLRVLTVAIGAAALGIAVDPLLLAVIVPVTVLVALAPISIGGFGPRETAYVGLLGLAGVAPTPALVLALLREAMNLLTLLPGAVLYARGPRPRRAEPCPSPTGREP